MELDEKREKLLWITEDFMRCYLNEYYKYQTYRGNDLNSPFPRTHKTNDVRKFVTNRVSSTTLYIKIIYFCEDFLTIDNIKPLYWSSPVSTQEINRTSMLITQTNMFLDK